MPTPHVNANADANAHTRSRMYTYVRASIRSYIRAYIRAHIYPALVTHRAQTIEPRPDGVFAITVPFFLFIRPVTPSCCIKIQCINNSSNGHHHHHHQKQCRWQQNYTLLVYKGTFYFLLHRLRRMLAAR
jgi:hypothetical protein